MWLDFMLQEHLGQCTTQHRRSDAGRKNGAVSVSREGQQMRPLSAIKPCPWRFHVDRNIKP